VGHAWCKSSSWIHIWNVNVAPVARWLSDREPSLARSPHQPSTIFIPARVDDNAFNNPEYRRVLEHLGGWQKRAWLEGDWDIAAGQFFTTFRRNVHVIADFDDTRAVEWWAALDYGYAHYTVVLLGCKDGDGNTFVVDEHAERLWLPERHAASIKAMVGRHLMSGVVAMLGLPRLSYRSDEEIQARPLRLEDLKRFVAGADEAGAGGDDAADALRHLVATKPRFITQCRLRGF
jgi:hypothetical protein